LGGAAIGGIAGGRKGALIGGAVGAVGGAVVGNNREKKGN
jgi:outer membrane lipoprotein SlyB